MYTYSFWSSWPHPWVPIYLFINQSRSLDFDLCDRIHVFLSHWLRSARPHSWVSICHYLGSIHSSIHVWILEFQSTYQSFRFHRFWSILWLHPWVLICHYSSPVDSDVHDWILEFPFHYQSSDFMNSSLRGHILEFLSVFVSSFQRFWSAGPHSWVLIYRYSSSIDFSFYDRFLEFHSSHQTLKIQQIPVCTTAFLRSYLYSGLHDCMHH